MKYLAEKNGVFFAKLVVSAPILVSEMVFVRVAAC